MEDWAWSHVLYCRAGRRVELHARVAMNGRVGLATCCTAELDEELNSRAGGRLELVCSGQSCCERRAASLFLMRIAVDVREVASACTGGVEVVGGAVDHCQQVFSSQRFQAPGLPGVRPGYACIPAGLKFEQASPNFEHSFPNFERTPLSKSESLNGKSAWRSVNNHLQGGDSFHVPDLNSSMQMDEDSPGESPSSGFVTKSYLSWHNQDKIGRESSEAYMPLLHGSKNGTIPGKTGTMGKEMPTSHPYNVVDPYYNASGVNPIINAAIPLVQCGDLPPSQGEDKAHPKKMTKKERVREERRMQREHELTLKSKQKLIEKEEKKIGREKQMEENKRQREVTKSQTATEKVSMLKNQTKGHAGEIPTSFSEDDAAGSSSSME